jgi:hypothetical protein
MPFENSSKLFERARKDAAKEKARRASIGLHIWFNGAYPIKSSKKDTLEMARKYLEENPDNAELLYAGADDDILDAVYDDMAAIKDDSVADKQRIAKLRDIIPSDIGK